MNTFTQTGPRSLRTLGFTGFCLILGIITLPAQVGNENPTGPAGVFNGNITTGCSYDPFTGNATRRVTDLVVAGGVGTYPLAFSRTANSRYLQANDFGFAQAGGWRHSYAWEIDGAEINHDSPSFAPTEYPVYFPDGRIIYFTQSSSDIYFRGPPGVRERFQPLNRSTMLAYLILPDGGKVEFKATRLSECDYELRPPCSHSYSYRAQAIIDPYGIRTTLSYNPDGSLNTIQEPSGRWLQLTYVTTPWVNANGDPDRVIDQVISSDFRIIKYNYAQASFSQEAPLYTYLASVVYPYETDLSLSPTASYTYQAPNGPNPNGFPLLATCDDPMYAGPMKRISYAYATSNGDPLVKVVVGQILSENSASTGQVVSRLYIPFLTWRNEVRGDGRSRRLEYDGGLLKRYTDFKNITGSQGHDTNSYVNSTVDRNQHRTDILNDPLTGRATRITYPLTPPDTVRAKVEYEYGNANCPDPNNRDGNNPYYVCRVTDERGNPTMYWRDSRKRVVRVDYPSGGGFETFSYNDLNQITSHRRQATSSSAAGGLETFVYDTSFRLKEYRDPYHPSVVDPEHSEIPVTTMPSLRYSYNAYGHIASITDARNNTIYFHYNMRGQKTRVTHHDSSYAQFFYNADGTLAWTADENHPNAATDPNQRTRYIYDDYKRVIRITNPLNEASELSYAPWNGAGPYSHTTASVYRATSPMLKLTDFDYDENFRKKSVRKGVGSADDDGGTYFGYDNAGNLTSVRDPRNNVTAFGYDSRNRRISKTDPAPFNDQVTRWEYDPANNLTKETRPDQASRQAEFDPMNRLRDSYGFANEHIHYERTAAGSVLQMTDPKGAIFSFAYDLLDRRVGATYPVDATGISRTESWRYDAAGNVDQYTNPAGHVQTITYDQRNRPFDSWWNAGGGPFVSARFDNANHLTSVTTNHGETVVLLGYDDAGRKLWEEQRVAGFPTGRVETTHDDDGNRDTLRVPGLYAVEYDYTSRGQLRTIYGSSTPWFRYSYDLAGNMIKRQDVLGGVNDSTNVVDANGVSQYDALNRPTMWEQTGQGNQWFARSHMIYDSANRLRATWRDEQGNLGDYFAYDASGQLVQANYNADEVWNLIPMHSQRRVQYAMTSDKLNRLRVDEFVSPSSNSTTEYTSNALNQYTGVAGAGVTYDGNFNLSGKGGFIALYDSANHLVQAANNGKGGQFTYDGLGRCLKRTIDGQTRLIVYDGWKPIIEWDEFNNLKAWNVYGSGPDEILYRHDVTYGDLRYHLDQMGNVMFLLNGNGVGIEKYTYDAFGRATVTDWNGGNPREQSNYGNRFMFQGREYLAELGIYDFRFRHYQPQLGRFLQRDPIRLAAGDTNVFRYCSGDPVNRSDPFGLVEVLKRPLEAMTPPVVVFGNGVETAESAGMGPQYSAGPLDYSGGAPGEGSAQEGGGEAGRGSSPSPTPKPGPAPTPTPTPYNWQPAKDYAAEMMLVGGLSILAGLVLETIPSGISQVAGGALIVGGLVVGGTGAFLYLGASQAEARGG